MLTVFIFYYNIRIYLIQPQYTVGKLPANHN